MNKYSIYTSPPKSTSLTRRLRVWLWDRAPVIPEEYISHKDRAWECCLCGRSKNMRFIANSMPDTKNDNKGPGIVCHFCWFNGTTCAKCHQDIAIANGLCRECWNQEFTASK